MDRRLQEELQRYQSYRQQGATAPPQQQPPFLGARPDYARLVGPADYYAQLGGSPYAARPYDAYAGDAAQQQQQGQLAQLYADAQRRQVARYAAYVAAEPRYPYGIPYAGAANRDPYAAPSTADLLFQQQSAAAQYRDARTAYPTATPSNTTPTTSPLKLPPKPKPKPPKLPSSANTVYKKVEVPKRKQEGNVIKEEESELEYFTGCVPLGVEDDKYWLSELQVYLRAHFAEAFAATEDDIAAPMHGRNKPIALGQVGIRCMHCKSDNPAERGQQATSYPSLISGIYNSVQQMLRLHLDCCLSMPLEVRQKIEALKLSCSSRGGRKQYWIDSAKRLGLVDTPYGIHFGRDPSGPLPPLTGPSVNSKEGKKKKLLVAQKGIEGKKKTEKPPRNESPPPLPPPPPVDSRPLVLPQDKPLISDYLYLTLEQMAPCTLMESDRVGCYKTRKVGFPGLACKHCVGQAGCGRYFPASEASLSQTTTSQTIMNHVRNCRRCPIEIRENLELMKRNRMGPDRKRPSNKPKHGGRKVFFHRLWCRIQDIPYEEDEADLLEKKKKKSPRRSSGRKGKRKRDDSDMEETDEEDYDDYGDETDTEIDSEGGASPRQSSARKSKKKPLDPWFEGCVRLTKIDDPHWLTEMECFARSDLLEAFTLTEGDSLEGYGGRKEPAVGQVGIRCVFCKNLESSQRPAGGINFPDSLGSLHSKVADMIRLHFPTCPAMPDGPRETFKSLKGYDAKVADDDSHQYWVDAARDLGLSNIPPDGADAPGSWGITFRRDPLQPSPADELDLEARNEEEKTSWGKNMLVEPSDRGLCTDQTLLLLQQIRPCRFKKSDRRAGPGSRGRDRAMGFPGLACMHCVNKNTLGRYFPVSSKNLTDNTANAIQSHVSSCSRCPEPIKASIAYLGHRALLQKAELSGSWKKNYYKKVWDRLHVNRTWTAIDDIEGGDDGDDYSSVYDDGGDEEAVGVDNEDQEEDGNSEGEEEEEEEEAETAGNMNALIKAAAIWLTEQDQSGDGKSKGSKGRSSSGKPSRGGRSTTALPTKRRRAHY